MGWLAVVILADAALLALQLLAAARCGLIATLRHGHLRACWGLLALVLGGLSGRRLLLVLQHVQGDWWPACLPWSLVALDHWCGPAVLTAALLYLGFSVEQGARQAPGGPGPP